LGDVGWLPFAEVRLPVEISATRFAPVLPFHPGAIVLGYLRLRRVGVVLCGLGLSGSFGALLCGPVGFRSPILAASRWRSLRWGVFCGRCAALWAKRGGAACGWPVLALDGRRWRRALDVGGGRWRNRVGVVVGGGLEGERGGRGEG